LDRGRVFGNLPPAVIRNLSDDFQQLDRSNPQQDCWHIEIKPQSDKLLAACRTWRIDAPGMMAQLIRRLGGLDEQFPAV
jgi:hypothetical protein